LFREDAHQGLQEGGTQLQHAQLPQFRTPDLLQSQLLTSSFTSEYSRRLLQLEQEVMVTSKKDMADGGW
jgi:hypothetical protein